MENSLYLELVRVVNGIEFRIFQPFKTACIRLHTGSFLAVYGKY